MHHAASSVTGRCACCAHPRLATVCGVDQILGILEVGVVVVRTTRLSFEHIFVALVVSDLPRGGVGFVSRSRDVRWWKLDMCTILLRASGCLLLWLSATSNILISFFEPYLVVVSLVRDQEINMYF